VLILLLLLMLLSRGMEVGTLGRSSSSSSSMEHLNNSNTLVVATHKPHHQITDTHKPHRHPRATQPLAILRPNNRPNSSNSSSKHNPPRTFKTSSPPSTPPASKPCSRPWAPTNSNSSSSNPQPTPGRHILLVVGILRNINNSRQRLWQLCNGIRRLPRGCRRVWLVGVERGKGQGRGPRGMEDRVGR